MTELHIQKQIAVGLLLSGETDEFIAEFTGLPLELIRKEREEMDTSTEEKDESWSKMTREEIRKGYEKLTPEQQEVVDRLIKRLAEENKGREAGAET